MYIHFLGATNRPQELDEAARRRLTKRLYIPLPASGANLACLFWPTLLLLIMRLTCYWCIEEARAWIVENLLEKDGLFKLSREDIDNICKLTEGTDLLHSVEIQNFYNYLLHFHNPEFVALFCRVLRIRHEKLSEGCLYGSSKRSSETRHRNNKS